jgi:hypothetical protein
MGGGPRDYKYVEQGTNSGVTVVTVTSLRLGVGVVP